MSNAVFTVTGKATDNVAVSNVLYQLNSNGWANAVVTNHGTNCNWTASITAAHGSNTLQAYAVDTSTNYSLTDTVRFLYIPTAVLTVETNGRGSVTPVDNGKPLYVNSNYSLTASPVKNWIFSNWVASGSENFVSNNPVLKFTMQSNLVLQANFVTNPFPAIAGSFNGLFYQTNAGSPVTEQSSGFVTITIASTSQGAYSAKLVLDGGTNSFTGAFDLTGKYTFVLPGSTTPSTLPGGYGAATFTNNLAGTAVLAGALGDSASINQSVPISQDGLVPVYVPLYAGQGSLFGWLTFSNVPPQTVSGDLAWFKLSGLANTLYTNGFAIQTNIIGSVYVPSTANILALTNGTLTISDPGQDIYLVYTNVSVISNKLSYTAPPTNQLTVTFTPASGTMTVSFRPTGAKANIPAQGVVLQDAPGGTSLKAAGWFVGTNETGSFELIGP